MKAAVFDRFGEPTEVLQVRDVPLPEPGPGEVRVRMLASPINPSDVMTVRGVYGRLPQLPATPGFEGVGVVDKAGPGWIKVLRGLKPGKRVAVLNSAGGNWAEYTVVPARQLVPVGDLTDAQAATYFVNPATAWIMVNEVLRVPRGEWLLQTAAGSALGRMVQRLAEKGGFRLINVVRRQEQAEEFRRAGLVALSSETESIAEEVRKLTEGEGIRYAIDCVGGLTAGEVVKCLGKRARMLVYGTLSMEPIPVAPRGLMWGNSSIEGFWLTEWLKDQSILRMLRLFDRLTALIREGVLTTDTVEVPLTGIAAAMKQAESVGKTKKVLLRIAT